MNFIEKLIICVIIPVRKIPVMWTRILIGSIDGKINLPINILTEMKVLSITQGNKRSFSLGREIVIFDICFPLHFFTIGRWVIFQSPVCTGTTVHFINYVSALVYPFSTDL